MKDAPPRVVQVRRPGLSGFVRRFLRSRSSDGLFRVFFVFQALVCGALGLWLLYVVKCALGINLMASHHLSDFFPW